MFMCVVGEHVCALGCVFTLELISQLPCPKGCTHSSVLTDEDLLMLHTTLTETFTAILQFLDVLKRNCPSDPSLHLHPVTMATVRVIGAWLAEETLAITSELYTLLPFLLIICQKATLAVPTCTTTTTTTSTSLSEGDCCVLCDDGEDMMKFLLPGLHHLTADAAPRKVLVCAKLHPVLCKYFIAIATSNL